MRLKDLPRAIKGSVGDKSARCQAVNFHPAPHRTGAPSGERGPHGPPGLPTVRGLGGTSQQPLLLCAPSLSPSLCPTNRSGNSEPGEGQK